MGQIIVKGLGKAYRQYSSRWSRLLEWAVPFVGIRHTLNWVLKEISFDVQPGESIGVIGVNGAGKSTLLKMIAGIAESTEGSIMLKGRVAALLELGIGFHPDFTGRENVIMAGQLLGIKAKHIIKKMKEIEEFAEIGEYIDYPVRIYSSGMQIRLAFSVATAIRPDILIIDEALSVGDAQFQHKSFARISEYRRLGTTLFIVSHDVQAILNICDRAILLDGGKLIEQGSPEIVLNRYNELLSKNNKINLELNTENKKQNRNKFIAGFGTGEAEIVLAEIMNERGEIIETTEIGDKVTIKVIAKANSDLSNLSLGYVIKDRLGQPIYGTNTFLLGVNTLPIQTNMKIEFNLTFIVRMGVGSYSITLALHEAAHGVGVNYAWIDRALFFNVVNSKFHSFMGLAWLEPECTINLY